MLVITPLVATLRVVERPYHNSIEEEQFDNIFNAFWSLTTVGYAYYKPGTVYGKTITMIASIWETFIISLLIVSLQQVFDMSHAQKNAFHNLLLTRKAAKTITSSMRYYM